MTMVYVQNKDGKPLMPTTRYCYVRLLLKEKKARVVSRTPFTIRLNYDTPDITQDLILGIDPGRTNIGVAVVKEDGSGVFSAHLETRNKEVPLLMKKRATFRRQHRTLDRRRKRQRRAKATGTTMKSNTTERLLPGYKKPVVCHYIRNKEARFNNRSRPLEARLSTMSMQLMVGLQRASASPRMCQRNITRMPIVSPVPSLTLVLRSPRLSNPLS